MPNTAIIEAAISNNIDGIERHLRLLNETDNRSKNALMHAVEHGHTEVAKKLLSLGISVNQADFCGWNVLHYVAKYNQLHFFNYFFKVDPKAVVDLLNGESLSGDSPLAIAVSFGNINIVKCFLEVFKIHEVQDNLIKSINYAIKKDAVDGVLLLLEANPELLNTIDPDSGDSILHKLIFDNAFETWKAIREKYNAKFQKLLNHKNASGFTSEEFAQNSHRWSFVFNILGLGEIDSLQTASVIALGYDPRHDNDVMTAEFLKYRKECLSVRGDWKEEANADFVSEHIGKTFRM